MQLTENMVVADRYRLARMIGRGGMGSVWQAQHLGLDVPCAIKFIEGELANVAEAHQRFEREARAAAQLRSPHVVQIMDHGVWQGVPYIAMELLDGEDLGKAIAKADGGRLSPSELNPIIQQVCRALSKAHAAGVVHRDLKPDNIFLVNDDDGRKITKILDFGVAKSTSQAIDGSNTKTGAMLGTPYYMSPEQAQGIKSVDSRSDLWSLAVIVYQCLTGRLPFESEALGDLLVKIIVSPIPTPSEVYRGVPPGFDGWWRKAADRNPDGRFQTAKEFAQSLEMALGQSSVTEVNFDRSKLQKMGGGTAVLQQSPVGRAGSTPPGTVVNAPPPHMSTPNPVNQSGGHMPMMQTPPGAMGQPVSPITNPHMGTANPVVAEAGIEAPKKGPPVAIIAAAAAALFVVGAILIGVTVMGKKTNAAAGDPIASASVTSTSTAPGSSASSEAKNATPTPTDTASAKPSEPEPTASASAAPSATIAAKPAQPGQPVAVKPVQPAQPVAAKPVQPAQPTAKPTATPKPTGGGTNPLGF